MQTDITFNGDSAIKAPRVRSSSYPSYTIEHCVAFTARVEKEYSSVRFVPKEDLSEALNLSGGSFLTQLSSCVQYGLLDLKSGEGYRPSELFKKIKRPLEGENVNDFLIECFKKPELYKKIIAEYSDRQLPSESGLANLLDRSFSIKGQAADSAAKVFMKNLSALGLVDEGNILRIESYIPFVEAGAETKNNTPSGEPADEIKQNNALMVQSKAVNGAESASEKGEKDQSLETIEIPVYFKDKRKATLIIPKDFSDEDMKRVVRVLSAYVVE